MSSMDVLMLPELMPSLMPSGLENCHGIVNTKQGCALVASAHVASAHAMLDA